MLWNPVENVWRLGGFPFTLYKNYGFTSNRQIRIPDRYTKCVRGEREGTSNKPGEKITCRERGGRIQPPCCWFPVRMCVAIANARHGNQLGALLSLALDCFQSCLFFTKISSGIPNGTLQIPESFLGTAQSLGLSTLKSAEKRQVFALDQKPWFLTIRRVCSSTVRVHSTPIVGMHHAFAWRNQSDQLKLRSIARDAEAGSKPAWCFVHYSVDFLCPKCRVRRKAGQPSGNPLTVWIGLGGHRDSGQGGRKPSKKRSHGVIELHSTQKLAVPQVEGAKWISQQSAVGLGLVK